ncbi:TolC family protein [Vibrio sp. SCSIO 43135]|uniref:TolC family protein n=1 Tax=Vibrio sp. SCSIO 43135 TaxID=2819096 RepID=UPI0020765FC0|nr:TolC family protein [Vibrio sp. SCSIO 43135]USD40036.1 TolC family protein [Vibrio sp. SCSIO 43135]
MKLQKLLRNTWQYIKSFSLGLLLAHPQHSVAASLSEVVEMSLRQNLALESARVGAKASERDADINSAKFLPSLSVSANTTWNESKTHKTDQDTRSEYNSHGYNVSLSQSLFNLSDYYSQRSSLLDVDIQQLELAKTVQQTIQDVASTYFEVLKNKAQERATEAELSSAVARYRQLKRNVELGNVAGSEMYEVMAQKEQVANDLRTLRKDQKVLIRQLENFVQYPVVVSYDLVSSTQLQSLTKDLTQQLNTLASQENLDIQIAKRQVSKNRNQLRESGSDFLPSLSGSVSYSHNDTNAGSTDPLDLGRNDQLVYSLNLDIPIISGGGDYHKYQKSALELTKAEIDLRDRIQNTEQSFHEAISNINDNAESLISLRTIIKANYASYRGIQKAYKLGTRTITDLLAAESKLFNSIRDYENARYTYVIETLGLEQLVGRLNLDTIKKISALMAHSDSTQTNSPIPLHLIENEGVTQ